MTRIGELLLDQRKVTESQLAQALATQAREGRRLVSILVDAGILDFDDASRALGAQRGMPCVLSRHLGARDTSLSKLLPTELGRARCALPIGRTSAGTLIVCVRDPDPHLVASLETTIGAKVTLVISPASVLEKLVAAQYGELADEFDVDLASAVDLMPAPTSMAPPSLPPLPDADGFDPLTVRLADLDDARVTKDPSQSGSFAVTTKWTSALPPPPPPPPTFDATREALEHAPSRSEATDIAMRFVAGRWKSGVVLAIRDTNAIGYRGHGAALGVVEQLVVSLASPSTVKHVVETKCAATQPADAAPDELSRRLATSTPIVAPVFVRASVVAVIAVGDPAQGLGDPERELAEVAKVAQLLGGAYERALGTR